MNASQSGGVGALVEWPCIPPAAILLQPHQEYSSLAGVDLPHHRGHHLHRHHHRGVETGLDVLCWRLEILDYLYQDLEAG